MNHNAQDLFGTFASVRIVHHSQGSRMSALATHQPAAIQAERAHFNATAWHQLCDALAVPPDHAVRQRFEQVQAAYAEPWRHYHTAQHIDECLAAWAAVRAQLKAPACVALAIWLHDLVYDPKAKDNEAQSAALTRDWWRGALPEDQLATVCGWIEATQAHEAAPHDADLQALLDIDLAILAAEPTRFAQYEAQVAREYAHVPPDLFAQGRRAFLQTLSVRPALFHHPAFVHLEAPARANLARA